jgi:hypothetical protein
MMTTHTPTHYASVFGSPGTRVRMAGLLRTQWPLLIVVALAGYLLRAAAPTPAFSSTIAGVLFLALAVAVAAAANHSRKRLQNFIKGAKGEEAVARELALLPEAFTVFHGIASRKRGILGQGGADLDHVVLGPSGTFVIETKNWNGDITIKNGELSCDGELPSRPPLAQSKAAAATLRTQLLSSCGIETEVHPILCFASNRLPIGQQGASGVLVCNADQLISVIQDANEATLSGSDQQSIISTLTQACEP